MTAPGACKRRADSNAFAAWLCPEPIDADMINILGLVFSRNIVN